MPLQFSASFLHGESGVGSSLIAETNNCVTLLLFGIYIPRLISYNKIQQFIPDRVGELSSDTNL